MKKPETTSVTRLCAQAARQAEDAGTGENRLRRQAHDTHHHEAGREIQPVLADRLKQRHERLAHLVFLPILVVHVKGFVEEHGRELDDDVRHEENADALHDVLA